MASYRPKVLGTKGSDELLKDADNIKLVAAPVEDNHAVNKGYTDTEISTAVSEEADIRSAADSALQDNIDAETAARISADNTLQEGIDIEKAARINEDAALQAQLDTIVGDGTTNIYIKRSGDNMLGTLTLGTDKITLNATNGSATFLGAVEADSVDGGTY